MRACPETLLVGRLGLCSPLVRGGSHPASKNKAAPVVLQGRPHHGYDDARTPLELLEHDPEKWEPVFGKIMLKQ
jgi:hypothetical protein